MADINRYKDFLPWCKESLIVKERPGQCIAKLAVGFPPLVEKYTSLVIMKPYSLLRVRFYVTMETRNLDACIILR